MTCPGSDVLVALLDGALPPPALAAARAHVDGCAACRAALARLGAGAAALRAGSPAPEPSPFFAARLAARIAAEPPRPRGLRRLLPARGWRLALATAAVAVAVAGGALVVQRGRSAEEVAVAERLDLLLDYEVVASVGEVEDADDAAVVAELDELTPREGRP
ncbi:MAG TPA: zf-HC2 domain-containing protein [Anaeromyxobacter sp.]